MASILDRVADKLIHNERLSQEDAVELFHTNDLLGLGQLANQVKKARWDTRAHFVINRQINPTNICVLSCKFCDFATNADAPMPTR